MVKSTTYSPTSSAKICSIKFENKDIINVIKALDPCKAHRDDDISIRMLKTCDSATVKPLTFLTVCSYHVRYAFYSESKRYSCLSVRELLAQFRRQI